MEEFRVQPGLMKGWSSRKGEPVEGFVAEAEKSAGRSTALIWFVNPESWWPVRLQLLGLWILRHLLRRDL